MEKLLEELRELEKKAEHNYDISDMPDYEEKSYWMGVMDAIIDIREFINDNY